MQLDQLPKNVRIEGDVTNNTVIVEPSIRHINLVITLRGSGSRVEIGPDCALNGQLFAADGATIRIGRRTAMLGVHVAAHEGSTVEIGERCLFSNTIRIRPSDAHKIFDIESGLRINDQRPIVIGDEVWVGEYVQIAKGARVGSGSIIGATSFVSGEFPNNSLIAGSPARLLRSGVRWEP
ncbi:acyltransferase [Sphingomonas sp. MMS24-J13]|uniref:acyltransferase n=1 Tax=Sphingomonas sp. MMS24-J13 TaxID=3238686 RepID=UPI00384D0710